MPVTTWGALSPGLTLCHGFVVVIQSSFKKI
jgi:hypothetical protein